MAINIGDYMQSLYRRFGDQPGITIELHKELPAIQVHNDNANATVFLQGAQLSHYQRHGEQPVIWCSPLCDYREGHPLRGGIPVCWPWFGAPQRNPDPVRREIASDDAGAHGFARQRHWQLDAVATPEPGTTTLIFSLRVEPTQNPVWPIDARLTLTISIGEQLSLELETHNLSDREIAFSAALHSYLAISDIDKVSLEGLQGLAYTDCLRDWSEQEQQGPVVFAGETDRIYHGTRAPITLADAGWQRSLEVASDGSDSTVVWNPWVEKSRSLSQFPEDGYREMLCIETANADRDFVTLAPDARHRLSQVLSCRPFAG